MKMYVKPAAVSIPLPDALDAVIFVADIASEGISDVFASESSYDEFGNSYSKMSEEELLSLGKGAIQYIEDLPTLVRIGKLDASLLSLEQRKKAQEYGSQKFTSNRLTVQARLYGEGAI